MVNVPKTSRGRLKKQYFQPLSLLNVEVDVRPRVQLQRLRHAAMAVVYGSLAFERGKLAVGLFLAEFLYRALRGEQQPDERLFDYIRHSLEWLDQRPSGYANFHLVFLMHLSRFLGFYPNLEQVPGDNYFDLRAGTFCVAPPLHRDFLMPQEASMMTLSVPDTGSEVNMTPLISDLTIFWTTTAIPDERWSLDASWRYFMARAFQ
jgi:DNA repair protein RecO (recombination protein O)